MSTEITRTPINHISDELLDKLLLALHPVGFTPASDRYDIGYFNAQKDFLAILEVRLNRGELPTPTNAVAGKVTRWWKWW